MSTCTHLDQITVPFGGADFTASALAMKSGGCDAAITAVVDSSNIAIAQAIKDAGADYLLAVKANQPTLRSEIELFFNDAAPASLELRRMQMVAEVGAENNSTTVLMMPAEFCPYRTPVPTQMVSSDEYYPAPQNAQQREDGEAAKPDRFRLGIFRLLRKHNR